MIKRTLWVDPKKCISCGACVSLAPKSFELDEMDLNAICVAKNPVQDKEEDVNLAIEACPTEAIEWK